MYTHKVYVYENRLYMYMAEKEEKERKEEFTV